MPAAVRSYPWAVQPAIPAGLSHMPVGRGLRALFDLQFGIELLTGTRPSSDAASVSVGPWGSARDYSGTANTQWAHHPAFAITGPITVVAAIDRRAAVTFGHIVGKQQSASANAPYELRCGTGALQSQVNFTRAGTGFYSVQSGAALVGTLGRELLGARSISGSMGTIGDFSLLANGHAYAPNLAGGSGSNAVADNGSSAVCFGRRVDGGTQLDGRIYWVALWDRAISDAEFKFLFANPWQLFG